MIRLVLVGAGHAHLEVLRRLALEPPAGLELTLIAPGPLHHYSGMVPGYLAGQYTLDEIAVPVAPLVHAAGGRLVLGWATALVPERRVVKVVEVKEEAEAREAAETAMAAAVATAGAVTTRETTVTAQVRVAATEAAAAEEAVATEEAVETAETAETGGPGTGPRVIEVSYDLVSFAIGSDAAGAAAAAAGAPGVVASCKPIGRAVELHRRLSAWAAGAVALADQATGEARTARPLVVVGGGAAGVELALAAASRLAGATGSHRSVTLLEAGPDLLPGAPPRLRRRATAILAHQGVEVRTGAAVEMVLKEGSGAGTGGPGGTGREAARGGVAAGDPRQGIDPANELPGAARLTLRGGEEMPCGLAIWATAAVGWPIFRHSGLPLDRRGFLLTDDSLRSIADPRVFAAGDCGTLARFPGTPKAGVYAVREGPILHASLRAALEGRHPPRYRPQRGFLSILNTCDGRALLAHRGLVSHSRWARRLKDAIDRRFLARYV